MYTYIHTYIHTYIQIQYTHTHAHSHTWKPELSLTICMYVCIYCMYIYMYVCMYQEQKANSFRQISDYFDSAIAFLAYSLDVEVFKWRKAAELTEYLGTVTREMISKRKIADDFTELDSTVK